MIFLLIPLLLILITVAYFNLPFFGTNAKGAHQKKIQSSPNFYKGSFQNLSETPQLAEGESMSKILYRFFFEGVKRKHPKSALPSVKTDLKNLQPDENIVVWFGHSSYFIQVDGKTVLADPVFSGNASPIGNIPAFKGSNTYQAEDMPDIDYLFISHDHWDHLDYKTIKKLLPKVKKIITGLGVRAHLERWGYDPAIITELDWYDSIGFADGFHFTATPGRHFSGRTFKRNQSLWIAVALKTPNFNLFLGGDSGFDSHFEKIGNEYGPFDLALLECGQYNTAWIYIHMLPEEVVKAAQLLKAKTLMPIHWAKFALALHSWDESINRVTAEAEKQQLPTVTPLIGEKMPIDKPFTSKRWWEGID